jgi:predicted MFS family arabinose efflux permease
VLLSQASAVNWVLVLGCGAAGAALPPPVAATMRALWPGFVPTHRRGLAYSLEAVVTELVFIAGPLLVAVFVAVGWAPGAVVAAAALSACGALGMALRAPAEDRRIDAPSARRSRTPLLRRDFRAVLLIAAADATALGSLHLAIAGRATEAGRPALTGLLLSLMGCASVVGGLWFGGRAWRTPPSRQYGWLLAFMAIGVLPAVLVPGLGALGLALLLVGTMMAPVDTVQGELVATIAPADALGEAFTWLTTVSFAGYSLGTASAGQVVQSGGSVAALLVAAAASTAAAAGAFALRGALGPATRTVT